VRCVLTLALTLCLSAALTAQSPSALTVTLVTFGQGEEVFERFGHDALWFHDASTGEDLAYHWGLFDFNEPHFIARFVTGDTHYSMGGMNARALIEFERRSGRSVTLQRLALTDQQAQALRDFVRWNALDANKYYRYDYFQDNCATRLRDALDHAVGGAVRAATDTVMTSLSYRSESVRLTDGDRPVQLGIDLALGRPADRPLTEWQSFFIPMRLRDGLRSVKVPGAGGVSVPLVADERVLPAPPDAKPVVELASEPRLWPRCLFAGALLALLVFALRVMMVSRRGAAWGLALLAAGWYLLCGVLGILIGLAWLATRHVFWAYNENLLLLTPLCLASAVLAPMALLRHRAVGKARITAAAVVDLGLVALVLALIPGGQQSLAMVALFLPVHLALAWALWVEPRAAESL
jgi:hypothetical protein